MIELRNGDCLELMKNIPDKSIDMVLTDPPYNIGKAEWDKIEDYTNWCMNWIKESIRVLKENGTFIFWHNDISQAAEIIHEIKKNTNFVFNSVGMWHKPNFRSISWKNTGGNCGLRSWFNVFEFFFVFINPVAGKAWDKTGLEYIYSNKECFKPLKEWYISELERLGLNIKDIGRKYTEVTGRKPHMVERHYFKDSQFELPTQEVYESVYIPLGFNKSYEELRQSYEELRQPYGELRPVFNIEQGETYSNYFIADKNNTSNNSYHPCMKPLNILEKLVNTHTKENATVLDCFMGSGSTGVACINTNRNFIGIELDQKYFKIAEQRINAAIAEKE